MSKFIFLCLPAHGHINPTLAMAQELIDRGEDVVYYQTNDFRPKIEATGATFRTMNFQMPGQKGSPKFNAGDLIKQIVTSPVQMVQTGKTVVPDENFLAARIQLAAEISEKVIPFLIEKIREEKADCLLFDRMFLWAKQIAHTLKIPAIALSPTYVANEHLGINTRTAPAEADLITVREELLAGKNNNSAALPRNMKGNFAQLALQPAEQLVIVFLPRAFQTNGDAFDKHFLFVGPSFKHHRDESGDFPLDRLGRHPVLYISLGTIVGNQEAFYDMCFKAFGNTEWTVVMSIGEKTNPESLGDIPLNFITAPRVPQLKILQRSDLFISHGGMNSTMESLYFGVPLIVIPQQYEQEITAGRVQELELGIALDKNALTPALLSKSVWQVANTPSYRENAKRMREAISEAGGYKRAIDEIIKLIHSH